MSDRRGGFRSRASVRSKERANRCIERVTGWVTKTEGDVAYIFTRCFVAGTRPYRIRNVPLIAGDPVLVTLREGNIIKVEKLEEHDDSGLGTLSVGRSDAATVHSQGLKGTSAYRLKKTKSCSATIKGASAYLTGCRGVVQRNTGKFLIIWTPDIGVNGMTLKTPILEARTLFGDIPQLGNWLTFDAKGVRDTFTIQNGLVMKQRWCVTRSSNGSLEVETVISHHNLQYEHNGQKFFVVFSSKYGKILDADSLLKSVNRPTQFRVWITPLIGSMLFSWKISGSNDLMEIAGDLNFKYGVAGQKAVPSKAAVVSKKKTEHTLLTFAEACYAEINTLLKKDDLKRELQKYDPKLVKDMLQLVRDHSGWRNEERNRQLNPTASDKPIKSRKLLDFEHNFSRLSIVDFLC